jgi:putative glutamine amidotransferase
MNEGKRKELGGNMHVNKRFGKLLLVLLLVSLWLPVYAAAPAGQDDVVFALCRPSAKQVQNIVEMYEKEIIPLKKIRLIAVYHEDEVTDYEKAYEYVKENKLHWVSFKPIKGKVEMKDLFKPNAWTDQFRWVFENASGIIFTGGMDIPPAIYNEENHLLTEATTPVRTNYEISFLFHLLGSSRNPGFTPFLESDKKYTVLGICLGAQSMNVACGGSMYQDIPAQVYKLTSMEQVLKAGQDKIHSWRYIRLLHPLEKDDLPPAFHRIKLKKKSLITKEMGMKKSDTPIVLTSHHQALKKIGKNLKVIATSMDGKIVEAIEHKKYENVLGIQFHPEVYTLYRKGLFYKKTPGAPLDFNLREYLKSNPPSWTFHQKIWQWFSQSLME